MHRMLLTTRSRRVTELLREREMLIRENKASIKRVVHPHNPFSTVMPDGAWAGQPCFLIGGGPSLIGFDFERLRGKGRVIAINRAFEYAPWADILFFMDNKFYRLCHEGERQLLWNGFKGHKVFLDLMGRSYEDCYHIRSLGRIGLSRSLAQGLYHGNNSGVGALNLALVLRARPIYLLGYDMTYSGNRSHFHSGYGAHAREATVKGFVRDFERMAKFMREERKTIINLNPKSGLKTFRFGNIDEVLDARTAREDMGRDVACVCEPACSSSPA
jgi:hypothetical protein